MSRSSYLALGVFAYLSFLALFAVMAAFVGGVYLPRSIDSPARSPVGLALAIDVALLGMFGLQHSVMARPAFKRWWTRVVPAPIERTVYVLASNMALAVVMVLWQPLDATLWHVADPTMRSVAWVLFAAGWLAVPLASLAIDHLELFGVRQVWRHFRGAGAPVVRFRAPGPYRVVRHPLYVGWLLAFWVTPTMTVGHAVFSTAMTLYILIAIRFEERDLLDVHGHDYASWRGSTPMLLPRLVKRSQPGVVRVGG